MLGEWRFHGFDGRVETLHVDSATRTGGYHCRFKTTHSDPVLQIIGAASLAAWAEQGIIRRPDQPADVFTTYECQPGQEYGWVTDKEWFEDTGEIETTIRRRYRLIDETKMMWIPPGELCPRCGGDEQIPEADPPAPGAGVHVIDCPDCEDVPGLHPQAGHWIELEGPS